MAEWRSRGYVADSDEEEESQESVRTTYGSLQEAHLEVYDVGLGDPRKQSNETVSLDNGRNYALAAEIRGERSDGEEPGKRGTDSLVSRLTGHDGLGEIQDEKGKRDSQGLQSQDDGEIDELHEDHYNYVPAAHLEAELLQAAREVTSPARSGPLPHLRTLLHPSSPTSSPLSDMGEAPDSRSFMTNEKETSKGDSRLYGAPSIRDASLPSSQMQPTTTDIPTEPSRAVRTLRHRNPIQLHPYAIESEKYKQILKARGVKPLRIGQMEAEAVVMQERESQKMDYRDEDSQETGMDRDQVDPGSSSTFQSQNSPTGVASNAQDIFVFGDDDDLPDVNTLLRNPGRKYTGNGNKRRKIAPASFRMPSGMIREARRSPTRNSLDEDDVMFDTPPSPPLSGSQTPSKNRPDLPTPRLLQKRTQAALPTPGASSEPRRRQDLETFEDELSDIASHHCSRRSTLSDYSEADGNPSETESSHQLQRVQRRIRGVLPASWLKLDLKARQKKPREIQKPHHSPSPEVTAIPRGVARPVTVPIRKNSYIPPARTGAFVLSDDEGSVSNRDDTQQHLPPGQDVDFDQGDDDDEEGFFGDRFGEAAENDRIDAMLPSTKRPGYRQELEKKRQTKIADFESHSRPLTHGLLQASQGHRPRQPRLTERMKDRHARNPKFRPPKLSILDAPSLESSSQRVPRFLKVATRAARLRIDKGRHSPSRKYVRLATKEDDQDASETLRNWRGGTIAPSANYRAKVRPDRRPLTPRSANNASPPPVGYVPRNSNVSRQPTLRSTPLRPQLSFSKRRKLQSSLDHLVQCPVSDTTDAELAIPQRSKEKSKKRGQLISSIRANGDLRPALLETSRESGGSLYAQAIFQRDLSRINRFDDESGLPNILRLFEDDRRQSPEDISSRLAKVTAKDRRRAAHRKKKRRPQKLDVSASWSRQDSEPIVIDDLPSAPISQDVLARPPGVVITGLGPFGTRYTDSFDIGALPTGTCFHESTWIGGGSFARSLNLKGYSDLDNSRGYALLQIDKAYRWGPWNETVSSELGALLTETCPAVENHQAGDQHSTSRIRNDIVICALRGVIAYFSDYLSFLDPVDRLSCVQRCKTLVAAVSTRLGGRQISDAAGAAEVLEDSNMTRYIRLGTMRLVWANQLLQLSQHELVPRQLQDEVRSIVQENAQQIMKLATIEGFSEFERCVSDFKHTDAASCMIRDHQQSIEGFVVAQHVLRQDANGQTDIWKAFMERIPAKSTDGAFDIGLAEESWKQLFILIPFLELDANGILEIGRRFTLSLENWPIVRRLISPVLEASLANPRGQAPSYNAYCRALFGRCLQLINGWGWRRCESIIGTLFDFFARNNLAHLKNEESHGSPLFLEHLGENPSLSAQPEDRCFHILLKIIGSGIRHMRCLHSEKKVRDLVWRLMPNHGRSHPKEKAVRQADLDALRNHHDLLCTLYWASPSSCRPRLTVIRNLVNLESSHREACHINIRAWFNLVRFQLASEEPMSNLQPFAEWNDHLLEQILRQYSLARTEAEDQVRSVQHTGGFAISNELLESTVARNQRQVEAILTDALVSLKLAVHKAPNEESAALLLSMTLAKVYGTFDACKPQAAKTVIQALDVLLAFFSKCTTTQQPKLRDENNDSQDYGDWPIFEEDDELAVVPTTSTELPLQKLQQPLRLLLSNCFGSDTVPDATVLSKIIDVWVGVAQVLVASGARSWNDYLDRFGNESWSSLRDTEQTRKYTPYYLATLVEKEAGICSTHRQFLVLSWLASLVERESLLKYQHRLTESLLNSDCGTPILRNLPFSTNASTGRVQISASEFSERRISLISSVLSNMRVSLEESVLDPSLDTAQLRQEYKDLLKHLMGTMKHNYQELGLGSNVRGAYVNFVHRVVEFLQQHTSSICPIDHFFTDNGTFPLPASDPTYVVAQLKSYALRLQDLKAQKQLAVFLQSVSERAATDGQQPYLVGQLKTAMTKGFEGGVYEKPTLRSFMIKEIIPTYIEVAFTTSGSCSGWILALPYLQALQGVFDELLLDLDGRNPKSVAAISCTLTAFLGSLRPICGSLPSSASLFQIAGLLKLISACILAVIAMLPTLDYVIRLSEPNSRAVQHIKYLHGFAVSMVALLQNRDETCISEWDDIGDQLCTETRNFATQELRDTLVKNWKYDDREKQYWFTKGGSRREIVVDVGLYEEERAESLRVLEDFIDCLGTMPAFSYDDDEMMMKRNGVSGLEALIL